MQLVPQSHTTGLQVESTSKQANALSTVVPSNVADALYDDLTEREAQGEQLSPDECALLLSAHVTLYGVWNKDKRGGRR